MGKRNLELIERVRAVASPGLSSTEIAQLVGINPRHARKILFRYDMPRNERSGARRGENNHQFAGGRRITIFGYVRITPPEGYATAKKRPGRLAGHMLEHRYVMEQKLGRFLLPAETVDHADGLTLHNHPDNLRLFASNAAHLRETLSGKVPRWSEAGYANMKLRHRPDAVLQLVDIHRQRVAAGAVRLRQILLAALILGIDSPFLLGSFPHTKKAGIDMSCRSTIERALADLCQQWGWPQTL
jgi:hypothetical protein